MELRFVTGVKGRESELPSVCVVLCNDTRFLGGGKAR